MEGDLYDEFGNYIGPDLSDESDEEAPAAAPAAAAAAAPPGEEGLGSDEEEEGSEEEGDPANAVVLHEDKKYYPTAEETYGPGTEALVQEEDAQPLEVPIVAPVTRKRLEVDATGRRAPRPHAAPEFLAGLLAAPELVRSVAVLGALHHGKTVLLDMLVEQTHALPGAAAAGPDAPLRFTDARLDEQARGVSLKATPMTLVLEGSSGKSHAVQIVDAPGHTHFGDEAAAAARLADGALLVVDAAEGATLGTELAVRAAAAEGLVPALVITKLDRLILELKLPPADAYHKLRFIIDEVNGLVAAAYGPGGAPRLDPARGNVAFAAPLYGWSFTLESFAGMYAAARPAPLDPRAMARRLWGDWWLHGDRALRAAPPAGGGERAAVQFVLEPLWKLHAALVGEEDADAAAALADFGVELPDAAYGADVKPLLKAACRAAFGKAHGLADLITRHLPSPRAAAPAKVARVWTGAADAPLAEHMRACNPRGPLVAHVVKLIPRADASAFDALARVFSGTLAPGDRVRVLGEAFSADDEEDSSSASVTAVWAGQGRYRVPLARAGAGSWALLEGLGAAVFKTATLVADGALAGGLATFAPLPLARAARAVVKIAAEPLNPGELPRLVEGLRALGRSYPALEARVEESGEHTLLGTGELYLDSAMRDLREFYGGVEVKVADPVVAFCETVSDASALQCFAETPNRRNKLTAVAEPLDAGLAEAIERGSVSLDWPARRVAAFLSAPPYEWDALAARSVWAFGPDRQGPNVLLDDTLPGEVDKALLGAIRESVVQGFQWGAREGPLCDEPMRGVRFRLTGAEVAPEPLARGGGQVIPTARRVIYSAFLTAAPRLLEPVYAVEIQAPADCAPAVYAVLAKRRGRVTADAPRPGTPVNVIRALLPVMESFGFETDLRYATQGQAFPQSVFDSWATVPGDPLDRSIVLRPLEPAAPAALARDFVVKTRRRKGMSDDVSVAKFFDHDAALLGLARDAGLAAAL